MNKFDFSTDEGKRQHKLFLETSVEKMKSYVRYLSNTIDDFRNFFKPEQEAEQTSVDEMLQNTLNIIGKKFGINQITLDVKNDSHTPLTTYGKKITKY